MGSSKKYSIHDSLNVVNEALTAYTRDFNPIGYTRVESSHYPLSGFFDNTLLVIHTIRKGVPYALFEKIKSIAPYSEEEWADYLGVSSKTLQRSSKVSEFRFKPIHSEKILELAEVMAHGLSVFDSTDHFYTWLGTRAYALGNIPPSELLKDSYGKELVLAELNRIDQGIFA